MRKTRLFLSFCSVLILSPIISLFLLPLADVSAASLDKFQPTSLSATPAPFSPNGDGRLDVVTITSVLNIEGTGQTANAVLKGELAVQDSSGHRIAHLAVGKPLSLAIGKSNEFTFSSEWDGKTSSGEIAADGTYFYTVDLSLLKGCKGNGDNRDDLYSGYVDLLGDCNSGVGNDSKGERIITTSGPYFGEISIDNTPPTITIEGAADGDFLNKDVTPSISIFDQHMASQLFFLNNQPFLSGTPVKTEGHYALSIIAEDNAANAAKVDIEFTIDKTPPKVNIVSPADGSQIDTTTPQISFEYSDSVAGIDVSKVTLIIDHIDVTSDAHITDAGTTYLPLTAMQEGAHTIVIAVADKSGNRTVVSSTFTVRTRCAKVVPPHPETANPYIFPEPGLGDANGAVEIADVNRDGYLDIVGGSGLVLDLWGNSKNWVSVLLGKGDGGFDTFAKFSERHNSSHISHISLGDFNNDCYPDIAVSRSEPNELFIFINNGEGTFNEKSVYGIGFRSEILTGRFDGDRYEDIVVYSDGIATIFRGNGDGTFTVPVQLTTDFNYSKFVGMTVLDMNEDGITDIIAVMGESDSSNAFLRGREIVLMTGSRQGDFTPSLVYTVDDSGSIGEIVAGDFNGDGHIDILVPKQPNYYDTSKNVDINLMTFLGDGNGWLSNGSDNVLWADGLVFGYGYYNKLTIALDVNGDNSDDIAVNGGHGKVYVYVSNEDGTFRYSQAYNINNNHYQLNSGDFDGDGDEDIVTTGAFVLFNRATELL